VQKDDADCGADDGRGRQQPDASVEGSQRQRSRPYQSEYSHAGNDGQQDHGYARSRLR
jgi:hypothetical protein